MQITITLTDQEQAFLKNIQNFINSNRGPSHPQCTLEEVIHECITTAISVGTLLQRGRS